MIAALFRWLFPPHTPLVSEAECEARRAHTYTTDRQYDNDKAVAGKKRSDARLTQRRKVESRTPTRATRRATITDIRQRRKGA